MIVPVGNYPYPQNPLLIPAQPRNGYGEFVNANYSVPQNPFGMGEFVKARYSVPQNPFTLRKRGMGCGCSVFPNGMGQDTSTESTLIPDLTAAAGTVTTTLDQYLTDIENAFQTGTSSSGSSGIWTIAAIGAGLVLVYWLISPGGKEYQTKRASLESQYRGYRRVGRTARSAVAAATPAGLTRKTTYRRKV
jgi:hypothetical protein